MPYTLISLKQRFHNHNKKNSSNFILPTVSILFTVAVKVTQQVHTDCVYNHVIESVLN